MSVRCNVLYFFLFFLLVFTLSVCEMLGHVSLEGSRSFFLFYAFLQAAAETLCLLGLSGWAESVWGTRGMKWAAVVSSFVALVHFVDFMVYRILDLSVWEAFQSFVLGEAWENWPLLLEASGLSLQIWGLMVGGALLFPFLGIAFYRLCERLIPPKPLRGKTVILFSLCIPLLLFAWDLSITYRVDFNAYNQWALSLPWKGTWHRPKSVEVAIGKEIHPPSNRYFHEKISEMTLDLDLKPNIYLFVVESLRRDRIDPISAPHISGFQKKCLPIKTMVSNANATNLSWFSLFHARSPLAWSKMKEGGENLGSAPLALLKQWGYQIHVYSSANLGYYGMDRLIFGDDLKLADAFHRFPHGGEINAAEADRKSMELFLQDVQREGHQTGQVFVFFWDATHFDYNWPQEKEARFEPCADSTAYFQMLYTPSTLEKIRNRYRNAVFYMDELFGLFLSQVPHLSDSIVAFLGDHGEEHMEKGHLFHCSHLTKEQTEIPLFIAIPNVSHLDPISIGSQVDLFPTLFHFLSGEKDDAPWEGISLLRPSSDRVALISRFRAGRDPVEVCFHDGEWKLTARLTSSNGLVLRSLCDAQDSPLSFEEGTMKAMAEKRFAKAWKRLLAQ